MHITWRAGRYSLKREDTRLRDWNACLEYYSTGGSGRAAGLKSEKKLDYEIETNEVYWKNGCGKCRITLKPEKKLDYEIETLPIVQFSPWVMGKVPWNQRRNSITRLKLKLDKAHSVIDLSGILKPEKKLDYEIETVQFKIIQYPFDASCILETREETRLRDWNLTP